MGLYAYMITSSVERKLEFVLVMYGFLKLNILR